MYLILLETWLLSVTWDFWNVIQCHLTILSLAMQVEGAQSPTESPLYGNLGQPPVPPRHRPTQTPTAPQIPPLPPRSTK